MTRANRLLVVIALAAVTALFLSDSGAIGATAEKAELAAAVNRFGLDLYQRLVEKDANLFFSPYSISVALSMTCAGAREQTEKQMAKVLHFNTDQGCRSPAFGSLSRDLATAGSKRSGELNLANAVWLQKGYDLSPDYANLLKSNFSASAHELDFKGDPRSAGSTINKWVEQQTKGKISELVGALDSDTRLVLANAVYFKRMWDNQFKKELTKNAPFTSLDGAKIEVPMMRRTGAFGYLEGDGFQALEMPYKGRGLSMVVLLPSEGTSLNDFEKRVSSDFITQSLGKLKRTEVQVSFPRFKVTTPVYSLKGILQAMGMTDAFSKEADFSGMTAAKDLYVSSVLHKAFVDVNEEGTEAAAATSVGVRAISIPKTKLFRADRPFIFLIRHNQSNLILFMGRMTKP